MPNEGFMGKHEFGGEHAHTEDHPPVFVSDIALGALSAGMILARNGDGKLIANDGTASIVGVVDVDIDAGTGRSIQYLAHGCVKAKMLKKADGTAFTNYADLSKIGIYAGA